MGLAGRRPVRSGARLGPIRAIGPLCLVAGLVAGLAVGCSAAPSTPGREPSADGATGPDPGAASGPATFGAVPLILVTSPDGGHTILDPGRSAGPERIRPLVLPPGRWTVTPGSASVALTSVDPGLPPRVLIGAITQDAFVQRDTITLPAGAAWRDGPAACLSGADLLIAADAGNVLWLAAPGEDPVRLPDQRTNRGTCTWLDDAHAIWDEASGRLAAFDLESGSTSRLPAAEIVRDPSAGQGRIAGLTSTGAVVVEQVTADGPTIALGPEIGRLDSGQSGRLSADGRWLVTVGGDAVARVFRVESSGLIPTASLSIGASDRVDWLPPGGP